MSAPAIARIDSVQSYTEPERRLVTETDSPTQQAAQTFSHEDVAKLAYSLWQQHGRPEGFPEADWIEAEEQLRRSPVPSSRADQS